MIEEGRGGGENPCKISQHATRFLTVGLNFLLTKYKKHIFVTLVIKTLFYLICLVETNETNVSIFS